MAGSELATPRKTGIQVMSLAVVGCLLFVGVTVALAIGRDDPVYYVFSVGALIAMVFPIKGLARALRMPRDEPNH